jgi:hypothetical protein
VLTASLLLGNASSLVPRLIPGAKAWPFTPDDNTRIIRAR